MQVALFQFSHLFCLFRSSHHCGLLSQPVLWSPQCVNSFPIFGKTGTGARLFVPPLQQIWVGRLGISTVMLSSRTSSSCRFPSSMCSMLFFLVIVEAGFHFGLRTRLGVPPPCARDPTFQPRTSPLRSSLRPTPAPSRSRRIPLLGRWHRTWCHALLAGLALLRFVTSCGLQRGANIQDVVVRVYAILKCGSVASSVKVTQPLNLRMFEHLHVRHHVAALETKNSI